MPLIYYDSPSFEIDGRNLGSYSHRIKIIISKKNGVLHSRGGGRIEGNTIIVYRFSPPPHFGGAGRSEYGSNRERTCFQRRYTPDYCAGVAGLIKTTAIP